jgi:release factor glutamine methyltransferase
MIIRDAIRYACSQFNSDTARLDAEVLLCHVLGKDRSYLFAHDDDELSKELQQDFETLIARRRQGEPVAHLTGWRDFWSLALQVTADTLIPRPETELLVEHALLRLPENTALDILDLGTGSGAIALALASERPRAHITATDISEASLAMAQVNADRLGLHNVQLLLGDWYSPVADRRFHIIVCNPPYIAGDDPHLEQGDVAYEPRTALTPGGDGLADLAHVIHQGPEHLQTNGWLLVEHGYDQQAPVQVMFRQADFDQVETIYDLAGQPRLTLGQRP